MNVMIKLSLIALSSLCNIASASMNPNTQRSVNQVQQQAFQRLNDMSNQQTVNRCITSGQPIPTPLISQMHPGAATAAYIHNINAYGPKK